ncbi:MAG: TorF family putative porin [Kiritimatiellales bacterium]
MKKAIVMMMAASAVSVMAASVDTDIGIYSKYIWRGMCLDDQPVAQGGITVTHESGVYANVWGNYSLSDDYTGVDGLNEVDYTVGYSGTFDVIDYDLGYIYYSFPNTSLESTSEIYAGLALNNLPITPSVYAYYDIDEADSLYVVADLNYGMDLSDALSAEVGASLAWADDNFNDFYYGGRSSSSLSDMTVYAGLSYALSDSLSLGASLTYSFFPDSAASDAAEATYANEEENLFGGVSLAYSF